MCAIVDARVLTTHKFKNNIKALYKLLQKLSEEGLKVTIEKSFFVKTETNYLGLWVGNQVVRPLLSNFGIIKKIDVPTKVRGVCRFLGLVHYYTDMWRKHKHIQAPLTKLSTKAKFEWTNIEQKNFMAMKKQQDKTC